MGLNVMFFRGKIAYRRLVVLLGTKWRWESCEKWSEGVCSALSCRIASISLNNHKICNFMMISDGIWPFPCNRYVFQLNLQRLLGH